MISMTRLACPKCGGQTYEDSDEYGPYVGCLACGYMKDLPMPVRAVIRVGPRDIEYTRRSKAQVKADEAVRRRQQGEPEKAVAVLLCVSPRQVRRWVESATGESMRSGTRRTDGNKWRGKVLEFKCSNTCLPCLSEVDASSNSERTC